ncbi:unnamed protein product [Cuscuta campestris]|uniref:Uncharacterized protein n=1 Tax=Cuscuta campestris TaxID=132261 RepID=A0A484LJV6_9ASTE|nr:unnamed protein product [Cuscuta campestris]
MKGAYYHLRRLLLNFLLLAAAALLISGGFKNNIPSVQARPVLDNNGWEMRKLLSNPYPPSGPSPGPPNGL